MVYMYSISDLERFKLQLSVWDQCCVFNKGSVLMRGSTVL